jgi:hypothetical protein
MGSRMNTLAAKYGLCRDIAVGRRKPLVEMADYIAMYHP